MPASTATNAASYTTQRDTINYSTLAEFDREQHSMSLVFLYVVAGAKSLTQNAGIDFKLLRGVV